MGFAESRFLGDTLEIIRDKQVTGEISTRTEALELAKQMLHERL
jgi:hypothetical protein